MCAYERVKTKLVVVVVQLQGPIDHRCTKQNTENPRLLTGFRMEDTYTVKTKPGKTRHGVNTKTNTPSPLEACPSRAKQKARTITHQLALPATQARQEQNDRMGRAHN